MKNKVIAMLNESHFQQILSKVVSFQAQQHNNKQCLLLLLLFIIITTNVVVVVVY